MGSEKGIVKIGVVVLVVLALVVGGVGGFFIGQSAGQKGSGNSDSNLVPVSPVVSTMSVLTGVVKSVSGDSFTMEIAPSSNPSDKWPTTRTVKINSSTEFFREQTVKATSADVFVPVGGVKKPVPAAFKDIKESIEVRVDAGQDVKTLQEFDAVRVIIL
jgi:hypothetical protein